MIAFSELAKYKLIIQFLTKSFFSKNNIGSDNWVL
jgi:hypothetical protein